MSNTSNDNIMQRAEEWLSDEYWTNTMWERMVERAIEANDLEALTYLLHESEKERSIQEWADDMWPEVKLGPNDVY